MTLIFQAPGGGFPWPGPLTPWADRCQIIGPIRRTEFQDRERAFAPPASGMKRRLTSVTYFFSGAPWPVASWMRAAMRSVDSAARFSICSGEAPGWTAATTWLAAF